MEVPMAHSKDTSSLACSFCGKSVREVRKLISGPTVYICDECVGLCIAIIREADETVPEIVALREGSLLDFLRLRFNGRAIDSIPTGELESAIQTEWIQRLPKSPTTPQPTPPPSDPALERLATQFNIPAIRLEGHDIDPNAVVLLTRELCEQRRVFPVSVGSGKLLLAMVDPSDIAAIDDVKFTTDRDVVGVAAAEADLFAAIDRHYPRPH